MRRFPLLDGRNHEIVLSRKISKGVAAFATLEQDLSQLRQEQITELEQLAIEGAGAYMTMYECNLRLVMNIASRQPISSSSDIMDMVQDGCTGLRRAIQKFDPDKGYKFSTYATYWIKQHITRRQADIMFEARLPAHAYNEARQIIKAINDWKENNENAPSIEDLINMGYTREYIFVAHNLMSRNRVSLDRQISDDSDASMYDFLPTQEIDFDEVLLAESDKFLFSDLIDYAGLSDREKMIISLKEGVYIRGVNYSQVINLPGKDSFTAGELLSSAQAGDKALTYDDVGLVVGLTRERVRQIVGETKSNIVRNLALRTICNRLLMDDEEVRILEWYFGYKHREQKGKNKESNQRSFEKEQHMAKKALSLIDILDKNKEDAVEEAMVIFSQRHVVTELNMIKINHWLEMKFGIGDPEMILPTKQTANMEILKLDNTNARIIESITLAVLAGVWGKIPDSEQIIT